MAERKQRTFVIVTEDSRHCHAACQLIPFCEAENRLSGGLRRDKVGRMRSDSCLASTGEIITWQEAERTMLNGHACEFSWHVRFGGKPEWHLGRINPDNGDWQVFDDEDPASWERDESDWSSATWRFAKPKESEPSDG